MVKPIQIWLLPAGPNPWKVVLVLEELSIPYEIHSIELEDLKKSPFKELAPNGRVPVIEDPNFDFVLWESGAIVQYLVEQYDSAKTLTYDAFREKHQVNQWLMFQVSGQGPYFGQGTWQVAPPLESSMLILVHPTNEAHRRFNYLHPEKIQSAIERYQNETKRVLGVLDGYLEGKTWLVGDKMTIADLAFAPWNDRADVILMTQDKFAGFPNVEAWHARITGRPSWKKAMETRAKLMDEQGLLPSGMPKGAQNTA